MCRIACLVLALAITAPAAAQETTPSDELNALHGGAADRVVKRDLLSVFERVDGYPHGNHIAVDSVGLVTKPYGTEYRGLCQRDSLTLLYAPTDREHGAQTPVRPYGIETGHEFQIRLPELTETGEGWFSSDKVLGDCARGARKSDGQWFFAPDSATAVRGYRAMQAVATRLRAGTLMPAKCSPIATAAKACAEGIEKAADPGGYWSVQMCDTEKGRRCFAINAGSTIYTIVLRDGNDNVAPEDIESVSVEDEIIIT